MRFLLVGISIVVVFVFLIILDRGLGTVLNTRGYFKAMNPGITVIYSTSEFEHVATISAQGIRNDLVSVPKPAGTKRILAIGDSITFGWGVDMADSWPKLLEKKLRENGMAVEIINAGVPGVGLTRSRYVCRAYAEQFDIDAIIIGLFADDLYQAAEREVGIGQFQRLILDTWPIFSRISNPIIQPAEGYDQQVVHVSEIWKKIAANDLKRDPRILLMLDPAIRGDFVSGKLNPYLVQRAIADPGFFTYLLDSKLFTFSMESTGRRLERIHNRCSKDRLPVLINFIPFSPLISKEYQNGRRALGYIMGEKLLTVDFDTQLSAVTQTNGFTYVSSLSKLRQDGCVGCYYPYDGHLTRLGHERVVESILPKVSEWLGY